jgi:hypothetical protein
MDFRRRKELTQEDYHITNWAIFNLFRIHG